MGANCCVATRSKPSTNRNGHEVSTYRNIRHSPSWSFRWHSRTQIEDIAENMHFSHNSSENGTPEVKSAADTETDSLSDGESPPKAFRSSKWRKSFKGRSSDISKFIPSDQNTAGSSSSEGIGSLKSSCLPSASFMKSSVALSHLSPPSGKVKDIPSSSRIEARPSPGHPLCSDSRVPSLESLNECTSPELSQPSFALSNDLSAGGSHGDSSDGWSMRTFSELVASSQRERWSFDSHENLSSNNKSSSSIPPKTRQYPQTCSICSKLLKEKSPWGALKILSTSDLPTAAVLFCGHIYHAECLESFTSEPEMYDPPCPVCTNNGQRPALKPSELKGGRNKILHRDSSSNGRKKKGKGPVMGASFSMKASSSEKPFLMRRFSMAIRPARSTSEGETTRKKSFWSKYRRE